MLMKGILKKNHDRIIADCLLKMEGIEEALFKLHMEKAIRSDVVQIAMY